MNVSAILRKITMTLLIKKDITSIILIKQDN